MILLQFFIVKWKELVEYRASFIIGLFGLLCVNGASLVSISILLSNFPAISGWTFWEISFNYCLFLASLGLHKLFFRNIMNLQEYIVTGQLDLMLVKPYGLFLQLVGYGFSITDSTDFLIGIVGIVISLHSLTIKVNLFLIILFLMIGVLIFTLILTIIASLSFFVIRVDRILYATMEVQEAVQHYPLSIYGRPFRYLVSTILPYGFINYYASLILLEKVQGRELMIVVLSYVSIILLLGIVAVVLWKKGRLKYASSGS